jgi:K+-sensing histidine kinase KdpD
MKFRFLSLSPAWRRYVFACLAVAIATGGVGLLMLFTSLPVFVIYIAAISVSTSYGGVSAGTLAAALAFFASTFLFIPPHFSLANEPSVLPLLAFYGGAVVLNVLVTLAWVRRRGGSQPASHRQWLMGNNNKRRNGSHDPY